MPQSQIGLLLNSRTQTQQPSRDPRQPRPLIRDYRNPPPLEVVSTLATTAIGTKRPRDDESNGKSAKKARTSLHGPLNLGRRYDSAVITHADSLGHAATFLDATNIVAEPSERPFSYLQSRNAVYYDPSLAMTIAPTIPPLLPPRTATALPTGLDPNAFSFHRYYPGLIVSVPWIEISMDPRANPARDRNFVHTQHGIICAKRRLVIVLWTMGGQSFLGLPITTHGRRGLRAIDRKTLHFHICLQGLYATAIDNDSPGHNPLVVTKTPPGIRIDPHSSVDLRSAGTIRHGVEVRHYGYLSRESSDYLVSEYKNVQREAEEASRNLIARKVDKAQSVNYNFPRSMSRIH